MRVALEEEGLYLANDRVVLLNMELGVVRVFERGELGFTLIPRALISVPSVLIVNDGGLKKYYVVIDVSEKDAELYQVSNRVVFRNVTVGHIMATVAGEAPVDGADKEKAIAYLRAL